ncbi:Isoleucine--tRNA ligase [Candidatus Xenohaliotis californiensis]|uniref:Isoleucine--tRNA ligase n=1 Tax=Candidatus Xenohaliotis californiensis TaxID=84677 RepID=A0ABP0EUZ2_9RICK|nr:Isoleucine--tRNA ligase [Candidatus Xenohaliotis californiensis]
MNKTRYPEISANPNFSEIEKDILHYWKTNNTFKQSIKNRNNSKEFVFYDGPPFANGMPHYGHLLTGFAKDSIARFRTMTGAKVERCFGWDCHGLPAEMGAEKELNISGKKAIKDFGVDKFNKHCEKSVMQFSSSWRIYIDRQARWVDFDNDYKTMDKNFMESVIWGFKELYKKGLVYKSVKVMPYSWACETPLSNFETRMDNSYRQKTSKAVTLAFQAIGSINALANIPHENIYFIAWTTTPWTLPSNMALAINKKTIYTAIRNNNSLYICALSQAKRITKIMSKNIGNSNVIDVKFNGESLIGKKYTPLFNYFSNTANAFQVLQADFVTDVDGTGIVHCAPGFGEDDFNLCNMHKIPTICPVDDSGRFTTQVANYANRHVFETNDDIIIALKNKNLWIATEQYLHQYPHCWRTDTPLIYKALPSWYVKVSSIKDRMVELNKNINWIPKHIKNGQFGKWIQNAHDWSISRQRFWGTPIPIWESTDPKFPRIDVYGSIAEMEQDFNVKIDNLHKPFIDTLTRKNPDDPTGKSLMHRVEDVFDCWFESGSMPYAQKHYPFENKDWFEKNFPADFITEYVAQTRGWFYTLMALSTAIFDNIPFKNCICHGVVLDQTGQKLSKRLNNYTDPLESMNKYGSDALRFLMLSSPVMQGGNLLLDKDGGMIRNVLRLTIKPIWNAYYFFAVYANADKITPTFDINPQQSSQEQNKMDLYILGKCRKSVQIIKTSLMDYNTVKACEELNKFFDILNNWYIRRNKKRFWKKQNDANKQTAYNTLFSIITIMCRVAAPVLPILSEFIYKNLMNKSVHLTDFPDHETILTGSNTELKNLINAMDEARDVCTAALAMRNEYNIRIRQPLRKLIYIIGKDTKTFLNNIYLQDIICDEVNVKEFNISNNLDTLAQHNLKPIFSKIAQRIPEKVKDIVNSIKKRQWQLADNGLNIADITLLSDEYELTLEPLNTNAKALPNNMAMVSLETEIDNSLLIEGIARDLVRLIQESRKQMGFEITDMIRITINAKDEKISKTCQQWSSYIKEQTLGSSLSITTKTKELELKYKMLNETIGIQLEKDV